jgi:hypothetical protein
MAVDMSMSAGPRAAAWHGLGAGSVLYLASQFQPAFAGLALLVLLLLSAFGPSQPAGPLRAASRALALRPDATLLLVALSGLVFIAQSLLLPNEIKPFSAVHLLAYLVVALARREHGPNWPALPLVRAVSLVNALLLLTLFVPVLADIFWYENLGQRRFRAFYFEPSIAAVVYVLNLIVLWHASPQPRRELPFVACNLVCLVLTFSGSGFVLMAAVLASSLGRGRLAGLGRYALLAVPAAVAWALTESGSAALQELVLSRAAGIAALEYDNSVHLRAVAPLLFVADFLEAGRNTWFGAGIGGIESYVDLRAGSLWFLVDFAGNLVPHINNGYVVVLALLGLPLGSLVILLWLVLLARARVPRALKVFALLYPLFSGFVIHPLLWLLVVMLGWSARPAHVPARPQPCTSP